VTDMENHLSMRLEAREAPQTLNGRTRLPHHLDVSIVMPCLNEEAAITTCVETALASLSELEMSGEVVVVDNDSSDRSAELARAAGARVVREPVRGYGMAYLRGLSEARGRYLVLGDSDGTYDFAALSSFVEPLMNGTDLVIGSRLRGVIDPGAMPWLHRYVGNPGLTKAMNLLFSSDSSDVYCGMRSVKQETLASMTLAAPGMEFALEMLIQAFEHGARIKEVPIRYGRRVGGTPKLRTWRDGWRSLRFIVNESGRVRAERSRSMPALSAQGGAAPSEAES
jgi:glycosyltransferase involved in cell wall biosynthesis